MRGIISQPKKESEGRTIVQFRHGQTTANKDNLIRGWANLPLDETGIEQAQMLGEEILEAKIELDGIFTSDLLRAQQTTLEISQITGIPILGSSMLLRPWNVGDLTLTDGEKAHKVMSKYAIETPDKDLPGGESFDAFRLRFLVGLIGILNSNRGLKLGIMGHSRNERLLHAWIENDCPPDLSVDMDCFLSIGEGTATGQVLIINSELVLS